MFRVSPHFLTREEGRAEGLGALDHGHPFIRVTVTPWKDLIIPDAREAVEERDELAV